MDIVKKEGITGLYRGMTASYLGVSEGVIQWVLYEVRRHAAEHLRRADSRQRFKRIVGRPQWTRANNHWHRTLHRS